LAKRGVQDHWIEEDYFNENIRFANLYINSNPLANRRAGKA
jgi:hypothetical protein